MASSLAAQIHRWLPHSSDSVGLQPPSTPSLVSPVMHPPPRYVQLIVCLQWCGTKWHPDRCARERVHEANGRFQQIQEAYEVLSDERRRALYDAGLYDCEQDGGVEDVEGFWDFVEEMVQLMAEVKSKQEQCTMEELQRMLLEMSESFSAPSMQTFQPSVSASTVDARARQVRWRSGGSGCKSVWFS